MNYRDLLESGANVSVTVNLDDLKEIFKEVAGGLKPTKQEPPSAYIFRILSYLPRIERSTSQPVLLSC